MSYNFKIYSKNPISKQFLSLEINDFFGASQFIKNLDYKRNSNKEDLFCVFKEKGGTCSSKHALLKRVADENEQVEVKLMLGIFRMNAQNTPKIASVLHKYNLKEIPEAHNYLRVQNHIIDCTRKNAVPEDFVNDLIQEIEIDPLQITTFKVEYHKSILKKYLEENSKVPYKLAEFWKIREECIAALQH